MVEISKIQDKCFAEMRGVCAVLAEYKSCDPTCSFYKPVGCEDWIRREIGEEIWLIPPEEYFAERVAKK